MLRVLRRDWIIPRGNGIRVSDLTIWTVNDNLATAGIADDLFCASLGTRLGIMMRTCATRAGFLHIPATC